MKVHDPDNLDIDGDDPDLAREYRSRQMLGWEDVETIRVHSVWYRLGRAAIALVLVVGVIWFIYGRVESWFVAQLDPPGEPGEAIELVVRSGATTADIGRQLEELGIIPNSTFFRYYTRWKDEGNFQAGEYTMPLNSSVEDAIAILNAGPKPIELTRFTVREGLWLSEVLESIASQLDHITVADLEAALASGRIPARYRPPGNDSWEGLLFPDTYEVNLDDSAEEVLLRMTDEFSRVTGVLGYGAADSILNYSAYEVLIVASLVEAETRRPEERPIVAGVIYNRLRAQWILGIDATCVYALGERGVPLTREMLDTPGPFNCRQNVGLPPTPINMPSEASLNAARNPEEVDYMFYALTGEDGSHTFSVTGEEHEAAVAICREKGLC